MQHSCKISPIVFADVFNVVDCELLKMKALLRPAAYELEKLANHGARFRNSGFWPWPAPAEVRSIVESVGFIFVGFPCMKDTSDIVCYMPEFWLVPAENMRLEYPKVQLYLRRYRPLEGEFAQVVYDDHRFFVESDLRTRPREALAGLARSIPRYLRGIRGMQYILKRILDHARRVVHKQARLGLWDRLFALVGDKDITVSALRNLHARLLRASADDGLGNAEGHLVSPERFWGLGDMEEPTHKLIARWESGQHGPEIVLYLVDARDEHRMRVDMHRWPDASMFQMTLGCVEKALAVYDLIRQARLQQGLPV